MRITGCFSRGFASVSMKISCLAHLSEEREVLALTPDPGKAASIAARHSHAIGERGEHAQGLDKGTLEFSGQTHKFFLIPASYLWCDLSFFFKANHYILVVFWL